jgi:hypothetical protein
MISVEKSDEVKQKALEMVLFTLEMMAQGGIRDHISKGFARYSTDQVGLSFKTLREIIFFCGEILILWCHFNLL